MGDRGNIVIKDGARGQVWLYTHWGGTDIPEVLHGALARRERWDDPAYLARIVFCQMLGGDTEGSTGFGISTEPPDNEHRILVVDCMAQTVSVHDQDGPGYATEPVQRWSISEYISAERRWMVDESTWVETVGQPVATVAGVADGEHQQAGR